MKTSVAMCTYNGQKFLEEQMNSILNQTVKVDEIVVCDDGSTDKTVEILQNYEQKFPGIFKIYINEKNLRSVKNFEKAISLCKNEIIFLSDQDDIWMPKKVEKITQYFNQNLHIEVVATNGFGIDEYGNELNVFTIWEVPQKLKDRNQKFNYSDYISLLSNIATGASMAFRRDFSKKATPFPEISGYHHDEWIAFMASENGTFEMLPEKLFKYRKHSEQQVGGVFYKNSEKKINRMLRLSDFKINADEKDFFYYKTILKRLAQSYQKFGKLANAETSFKNKFIEKQNLAKQYYEQNLLEAKKKHPLKFTILSVTDIFKNKRKI